jgi:outer membrane protein assembly factor BamB
MKISPKQIVFVSFTAALAGLVYGQGRGLAPPMAEWATSRGDAQRSGWVRNDVYISADRLRATASLFGLQWKLKVINGQRQLNSLTAGITVGGSGRSPLSVIGGSSNNVYAIDNFSGNEVWERHFEIELPSGATPACPGGLIAAPSRPAPLVPAVAVVPLTGISASKGPYFGGVGSPGEGVPVNLTTPGRSSLPNGGRAAASSPGIMRLLDSVVPQPTVDVAGGGLSSTGSVGASGAGRGGGGVAGNISYVLTSDGLVHTLGQFQGKDIQKPVSFLPAKANASDVIVLNNTIYAVTSNGCGGVANGVWALDLSHPDTAPVSWNAKAGTPAGAVTLSSDGTVFVAIRGDASNRNRGYSNAIVALDPKTLEVQDWFTQPGADFISTPLVFRYGNMEMVAAATRDGRIFLLNKGSLGGDEHHSPISISAAVSREKTDFVPGPLASWADTTGTRWVLEPWAGPIPASLKFPAGNGVVTHGTIMAFKVAGEDRNASLQPAWTSRDMLSPLAPVIVNGVVFAASSGEFHPAVLTSETERIRQSVPAVVRALDGATGQELWNSGKSVTSFIHSGGLWAAGGQVYIATYDNTIYGFGYPMGRR